MVGGDRAHVSASSRRRHCLCCPHVGWCGCGHARVVVSLIAMGYQRHCVVVMFTSTLSVQSRTHCPASSSHLRHAILVELWSSRPPHRMSCRSAGTWGTHQCRCPVGSCGRSRALRRHRCVPTFVPAVAVSGDVGAVAGSASEPFGSLIAEGRRGDAWYVERAVWLVDCTGGYGGGGW